MTLFICPVIPLRDKYVIQKLLVVGNEGLLHMILSLFSIVVFAVVEKGAVTFLTEIRNSQGYCRHHLVEMHEQQLFALSVLL